MLRRTARKAFRRPDAGSVTRVSAESASGRRSGRQAALDLVFEDLRRALVQGLRGTPERPDEMLDDDPGPLLSPARARPVGVEFFLCGRHHSFRFRHTMEGWIRIDGRVVARPEVDPLDVESGSRAVFEAVEGLEGWRRLELLAVHPRAGSYRPLRRAATGRSPFQYTTPQEIAADYLRLALGACPGVPRDL